VEVKEKKEEHHGRLSRSPGQWGFPYLLRHMGRGVLPLRKNKWMVGRGTTPSPLLQYGTGRWHYFRLITEGTVPVLPESSIFPPNPL